MQFPDTKVREHVGNIAAGRAAVLDEASIKYIFGYLSDLYSDRALAFIRETATNAWDSHVEAGVSRPIEVTLPTQLNPNYVIRDFGIGLDPEGVYKSFGVYAYSTKRESNDFNGMLGLGSKAVITYVDQFTVTAVKDGVRSETLITRGEDGVLSVYTPEQGVSQTSEANGVTLTIPVPQHRHREVRDRAETFFRYWTPGTVLVDGEQPAGPEVLVDLDPQVMLVEDHEDRIVMGNVAYPLSWDASSTLRNFVERRTGLRINARILCHVPTGEVMFTPSRESLDYTDLTNGTLRLLAEFVADALDRKAEASIAAAKSMPEAYIASQSLSKAFTKTASARFSLRWGGRRVPRRDDAVTHAYAFVDGTGGDLTAHYKDSALRIKPHELLNANAAYIVQPVNRLAGKKRRIVGAFLADGSHIHRSANFIDAEQATRLAEWVALNPSANIFTWDEVVAIAGPLPDVPKTGREYTPDDLTEYEVATNDGYNRSYYRSSESYLPVRTMTIAAIRETDKKVCYVTTDNEAHVNRDVATTMTAQGWMILRLRKNSVNKAQRLLDGLVTLGEAAKQVVESVLTDAPYSSEELPEVPDLDLADVLDPDVETLYEDIANVADRVRAGDAARVAANALRYVRHGYDESTAEDEALTEEVVALRERAAEFIKTYPLLFVQNDRYGSRGRVPNRSLSAPAATEYVNALHFFRTEFNTNQKDAA